MEIILAKTAGFCFGVARALDLVEKCAEDKENTYHTLGPIIHNAQVVGELSQKGISPVEQVTDVKPGETLIVRTHGVGKQTYDDMEKAGIRVMDVTCPFVAKIHKIVRQHYEDGFQIVIIGDETHPEVQGINGWCENQAVIIRAEQQAEAFSAEGKKVCIVAQTTFHKDIYKKIIFFLKKTCQNAHIFDTICSATLERQAEAEELASKVDVMIVLGGRNSSNTQKLYSICKAVCEQTYCLENIHSLPDIPGLSQKRVGITAGASTPAVIIKEAVDKMEHMEENFETLFEESLKTLNTGDVVKGTVIEVRPNEAIVDLGVKQDGFIPASEISDDPDVTPADAVKVGDEIEVFVVRVNDADGNIMLSKRKLDTIKTWESIVQAAEAGTVLEGKVTSVVKGGMIVLYKGYKIFVPASLANDRYLSDLSELVGKVVPFKIIDVNEKRKRVVGSVKAVMVEQKQALEAKFWETAAVGNKYTGTVKSLTNFGAFVDIGGVDGLVHISELSWNRIKHPSEVVNVGDTIEVYIKDINEETKKISLGFKKMEDNPWVIAQSKLHVGDVVPVKIVRMLPFGAFAEILPGVDGLIHISQIANKRIAKPQDELSIGQEVDVKIVDIDWENKKIGLSIRVLLPDEPVVSEEEASTEDKPEEEKLEHKEELGATIGEALNIELPAEEEISSEPTPAAEEQEAAAAAEETVEEPAAEPEEKIGEEPAAEEAAEAADAPAEE